ncbi:MAG: hypothetical protein ACFFD2_19585 [Promethearchaeota archaeon]
MSLINPGINFKLKILLVSKTKDHLLKIIKDYNEYCRVNNLTENMLKGYSKKPYNTKEGLVDFLLERLSDEEKEGILKKIEKSYLEELFDLAKKYIKDENDREKIESIKISKTGVDLKFKGWQWENETTIEISADGTLINYNCTCRIGQMEGFCPHIITGILTLIKQNKFNQETFIFKIPKTSLNAIHRLKVNFKDFEDLEKSNADIVLGNDYFISIDGNLVTLKWGGDRAGKTIKNIAAEKKPIPVEIWLAKKVVDKILAPLRDHTNPREILKDEFGVIPIILKNEKLVNKLLKKFVEKNETEHTNLPSTKEELKKFLTSHV